MILIYFKIIYERKVKDVSAEKKKEVLTALWDATSGLGEVHFLLLIQGGFFNWSALKMTKSQALRKF